jgi:hypothetical protein
MPVANTKSLKGSLLSYLKERPEQRFNAPDLAKFFGSSAHCARARLNELRKEAKIKSVDLGNAGKLYWFDAPRPAAAPRQSPITEKAYVPPPAIAERVREAEEHRAANPSRHL